MQILAQQNTTSPVFVYRSKSMTQDLVFTMSITIEGDFAFRMSGPSSNSWIAVGTGDEMKDSLMLVAYGNGSVGGVTLSTRIASGHNEPSFAPIQDFRSVVSRYGGSYMVDGYSTNCSRWLQDRFNVQSRSQPFIFALGPASQGSGDPSATATIQRHDLYGSFTMDMTRAVSASAIVPQPNGDNDLYVISGSSPGSDITNDRDWGSIIHAVVMCLAFVILFPLGALFLRLLESVKIHAITQTLASLLVFVGVATGIYISLQYNRMQHFGTAHQIIGLIVFIIVDFQLVLGLTHHIIYKRTRQSTVMGTIHLYAGPLVMILGIINAPLGLILAQETEHNVTYVIVVAIVFVLFVAARGVHWLYKDSSKARRMRAGESNMPLHLVGSHLSDRSTI